MKYWRGYLVAAILAIGTILLEQLAAAHTQLVDMIYPYADRIIMDYLAVWSSGVEVCLWQVLLIFCIALLLASIVLMIALRWNPVQWFGWVLAVFSLFSLLNCGMYGLNRFAGPLAEDVRLELKNYSAGSLERAACYYRDKANEYVHSVSRNPDGSVKSGDFDALAAQAADGFHALGYELTYPTFTGTTVPVKQLGWTGFYNGVTGVTIGLTGESCVNPNVPAAGLPFAICHEMSHRMCVYDDADADFGAFLACTENSSAEYVYSGYLMAFRACYNAISAINSQSGQDALNRLKSTADKTLLSDMEQYNRFLGSGAEAVDEDLCKLLVSWHIQEIAQFDQEQEEEVFDPLDETDDRFQDILYPPQTQED